MKKDIVFYVIEKPFQQYWTGSVNFGEDELSEWTTNIHEACQYSNKWKLKNVKKMYQIEGSVVQHCYFEYTCEDCSKYDACKNMVEPTAPICKIFTLINVKNDKIRLT